MTDAVDFTEQERKLFGQRKALAPLLAALALLAAAMSAAGWGGFVLEVAVVVVLAILGLGVVATEHATNLSRFDARLGDARMTRVATLRVTRRVLRGLLVGVVVLLAWLPSLRGDLPLIAMAVLAGAGMGLYAQVLFYREVALLRPVANLP